MRHAILVTWAAFTLAGCHAASAPSGAEAAVLAVRGVDVVGHIAPRYSLAVPATLSGGVEVTAPTSSQILKLKLTLLDDGNIVGTPEVFTGPFTTQSTFGFKNLPPNKTYTAVLDAYADVAMTTRISVPENSVTEIDTTLPAEGTLDTVADVSFMLSLEKSVAVKIKLPISLGAATVKNLRVELNTGGSTVVDQSTTGLYTGDLAIELAVLRPNTTYTATVSGDDATSTDVLVGTTEAFTTPSLTDSPFYNEQDYATRLVLIRMASP